MECGALPRAAIEAWASSLLTEKRVHELATESGGSPKRLEALLAEALGPAQPSKREAMLAVGFPSAFAELKPTERETLALIHSQGGQALAHHLGLGWQELDPLLDVHGELRQRLANVWLRGVHHHDGADPGAQRELYGYDR